MDELVFTPPLYYLNSNQADDFVLRWSQPIRLNIEPVFDGTIME